MRLISALQLFPEQYFLLLALARALDRGRLPEAALHCWLLLASKDSRQQEPVEKVLDTIERFGLLYLPSVHRYAYSQLLHFRSHGSRRRLRRAVRILSAQYSVLGAVELDKNYLQGWVFDPVYPTRDIWISIFINGSKVSRIRAADRFPIGRAFKLDLSTLRENGGVIDVLADSDSRLSGAPLHFGTVPLRLLSKPPLLSKQAIAGRGVDIVIPVYGNQRCVQRCLDSLKRSRSCNKNDFRLIVVNDSYPDAVMNDWLRHSTLEFNGIYLKTPRNLGFIGAINLAIKTRHGRDMVWLNADTIVVGDWLDRMRSAAYSAPDIATVTPFSNNAQLFSYPRMMKNHPMPLDEHIAELHRLAAIANDKKYESIPTGIGFCLYVRWDAIKAAGPLDDKAYLLGYSEEVDYCFRLSTAGWRHMCATDAFVAHEGSVFFQAEKIRLAKENDFIVQSRYPVNHNKISDFIKEDPLREARSRIESLWLSKNNKFDGLFFFSEKGRRNYFVYETLINRQSRGMRDLQICMIDKSGTWNLYLEGILDSPPYNQQFEFPRDNFLFARLLKYLMIQDSVVFFHDKSIPPSLFRFLLQMMNPVNIRCLDETLENHIGYYKSCLNGHVMCADTRYRVSRWKKNKLDSMRNIISDNRNLNGRSLYSSSSEGLPWIAVFTDFLSLSDEQNLLTLVRFKQNKLRWLLVGAVMDIPAFLSSGRCECFAKPNPKTLLDDLSWSGCRCILNMNRSGSPDPGPFLVSRHLGIPYVSFPKKENIEYSKKINAIVFSSNDIGMKDIVSVVSDAVEA
ncbi:glycosyltransferase family 2 protein [Thiorhodococcus fuscus]|uniref:Glycosyltransferase family 2 protein n=1 Tax=Thiorhodococcus fuscus TaxID=527200 RepID=A0ABW4YEU0_9GAMM